MHCSTVCFTRLSICGNHIFLRISDFVFSITNYVSCAMSIARCCKTAGITIRVPLNIIPCVVVVSSFFTALNGFTAGESHPFVLIASRSSVYVASALVASSKSLI